MQQTSVRKHISVLGLRLIERVESASWLRIAFNAILGALAVVGLASLVVRLPIVSGSGTVRPLSCNCGNSVNEARANGCKFDPLAFAWLPSHCRDEELTYEFERQGTGPDGRWLYWADDNRTTELSAEEISLLADNPTDRFYTSWEWHVEHCFFYWRKLHRSRFTGVTLEKRFDSEGHIGHCKKLILNGGRGTLSGIGLNSDDE